MISGITGSIIFVISNNIIAGRQLLIKRLSDIISPVAMSQIKWEVVMRAIKLFVLVSCLIISGCSLGAEKRGDKVVARINDYELKVEDLRYELESVPYDDIELLKTEEGREEYLDRLLEKEILLQEAQRQGLDRERDFMKSIENYWEQALLKLLLERKSREISGQIRVYDNEIQEYYRGSGERLSFLRVKADIRRSIRQKKETEAMNAWIKELRKGSFIKINKEILEDAFNLTK